MVRDRVKTRAILASVATVTALVLAGLGASASEEMTRAPEMPVNVWVKAEIDQKAALATADVKDAGWAFTDGYSDSVYRSSTGTVLIRTGIRSKVAKYSPGFYTNTTVEWNPRVDKASVLEIAQWSGGSYGNSFYEIFFMDFYGSSGIWSFFVHIPIYSCWS